MAATFAASFRPWVVPIDMASSTLLPSFSLETCTDLSISSVSGLRIFAIAIAPGAAITDALRRCFANSTVITGSPHPNIPI